MTAGKKVDRELPITTRIVQIIEEIEQGKRQMQVDNLNELARLAEATGVS
jgi:2-dehydropantoate 2-reductase